MKAKILSLILFASLMNINAFAQSSVRADELANNPEDYRLGDSNDLEKDEIIVEQNKICNESHDEKIQTHQKNIMKKHLLKNQS